MTIIYYWGTPLEKLADALIVDILFLQNSDKAYETAKHLYHSFIRINPNFWNS